MLTSFDQNTAEFYNYMILLTMICIFWPEFELEPHYFTLNITETEKFYRYQISFPL